MKISKQRQEALDRYLNKTFKTNNSGNVTVIEYHNSTKILVKFLDTGNTRFVRATDLNKGEIRDSSVARYYGFGVLDQKITQDKETVIAYNIWEKMLSRCYNNKCSDRTRLAYANVHVSETFKLFSNFTNWCKKQKGFGEKDENGKLFALDKDILSRDIKVYSEDTCCFVPREINALFVIRHNKRGKYPLGVTKHTKCDKYNAKLSKNGVVKYLGLFNTPEEAFYVYKEAKEEYVKDVANKYKDHIDDRVYEKLMNYKVLITD